MKKLIYFFVFTILLSCDRNEVDCAAVSCLEPRIIVNLIDDASKDNFILLNMLDKENIQIKNSDNVPLEFFIDENTGILIIQKLASTETIEVSIEKETNFMVSYDTSKPKTDACCDFGMLINVHIENKPFEIIEQVITIYI